MFPNRQRTIVTKIGKGTLFPLFIRRSGTTFVISAGADKISLMWIPRYVFVDADRYPLVLTLKNNFK